jgi:molecular chaperone DnaK
MLVGGVVAVGVLAFGSVLIPYFKRAYAGMQAEQAAMAAGEMPSEDADDAAINSVLGLDLGSSFSKIAHYRLNEGVSILENREGRRSVPSAIMRETVEAGHQVGHLARASRFLKPESTVFGIPLLFSARYMDSADRDNMLSTVPFEVNHDPESGSINVALGMDKVEWKADGVLATLADEIHRSAVDKLGDETEGGGGSSKAHSIPVILSSPNFLSSEARESYLDALRGSGLNAVAVVADSVCSVLGAYKLKEKGMFTKADLTAAGGVATVAVIDIGGRITQLSLLHVQESHDPEDLLGFHVSQLSEKTLFTAGGEFFDSALVGHMADSFKAEHGLDVLADPQATQRLHDAAETAKKDLTKLKMAAVNVPYVSANATGPLHLTMNITRSQLDGLAEGQVSAIKDAFKDLLFAPDSKAKGPLLAVVLCGGAGRMPFAKKLVTDVSGMVPVVVQDPECLAAIGASSSIEMHVEH